MSLFGPPSLRSVTKPGAVLDGGRTRLQVGVAGWGRLTLVHTAPDGAIVRRRLYLFGGERDLAVDVLPPCDITLTFGNPFGAESTTVVVRAEVAGVVALPLPEVEPLPVARAPVAAQPRLPATPKMDTPRALLGAVELHRHEIEWRRET